MTSVTLQVGTKNLAIDADILPPVGTKIPVHKHLTGDGNYATVEVIGHEWRLDESGREDEMLEFSVRLLTRQVN